MFEDIRDLWVEYHARHRTAWGDEDPRWALWAEVRDRLSQLDLVLEFLAAAIARTRPDPKRMEATFARMHELRAPLEAGELSVKDYAAALPAMAPDEVTGSLRAWEEIRFFTEAFYFVAWRLVEVMGSKGPFEFPGLRCLRAPGVRTVRNQLIQHPEKKGGVLSPLHLTLTDEGPVLRTTTMVVEIGSGLTRPDDESLDHGLYANVRELHAALQRRLEAAKKSASP